MKKIKLTRKRKKALKWYKYLPVEEKLAYTARYFPHRMPNSLTGREIEYIHAQEISKKTVLGD